ncbi:MAG: 4'-phosphopantetheinyl transferase superfamily protein [Clostridiales bacterium]|nr:4'-phosphopantetheinyl transferase superfamily protein [Clostridiales bacterium]
MKTKIYLLDVSMEAVEAERQLQMVETLKGMLSDRRREKVEMLRLPQDQLLSLGAGYLLDLGLSEYGLRECEATFGTAGNGKPVLLNDPEIHFNLSHSGTMAMAVFSGREAGCDVEREREARMPLAKRFFCREEYEDLAALPEGSSRNHRFTRYWTLKESFLKVTGEGMRMPLNQFRIHLTNPVWAESEGRKLPYRFQELSFPGYCAAVSLAGYEEEPCVKIIKILSECM